MEDDLIVKYLPNSENESVPNRFNVRKKYWNQLLPLLNNIELFSNVSASKDHWLSTGAGTAGVSYTFVITKSFIRIELCISTSSKDKNKMYFKKLQKNKEAIEQAFGRELIWEELPENKMSRIKIEELGVNLYNETDWTQMNDFVISNLPKFENAFSPFIKNIK
jgi:hypothetical protein